MKRYKALYNFDARTHDELTLVEGDVVTVGVVVVVVGFVVGVACFCLFCCCLCLRLL